MLDYTKAAFGKIINDVKKVRLLFELFTQLFMATYLFYSLFSNPTLRFVNGVLLFLTLAYLGFWLYVVKGGLKKEEKELKKRVTRIFKYIKLAFGLYTLAFAVYGIYTNIHFLDFISLLLTVFTVISFTLKVLLLVLEYVVDYYKNLIRTAIETDVSNALKPVNSVKKFFGKDVEEPAEPTKERLLLDKIVEEKKRQAQELKEQKKQEKAQKRQEDKLYKLQQKEEKRMAKQAKKQAAEEENFAENTEETEGTEEIAVTQTPALPKNVLPAPDNAETQTQNKKPWWKFGKKKNTQPQQNEQDG
ncbi:MAG: hypothetical protein IJB97_04605 [Clostridia bacterium]|nr:hypothetical protein [Clostridia bacterium]